MSLLQILTPINLQQEKTKFFSDSTYHPVFAYDWSDGKYDNWLNKNTHYKPLAQALFQQEGSTITSQAKKVFQVEITDHYLQSAGKNVKKVPQKLVEPIQQSVVHEFQKAFEELGLSEYSVEIIDKPGFNFRPSPSKKLIYMSSHMKAEYLSVQDVMRHELVHIVRYENGKYNDIKREQGYLPIEEGLASYCQDYGSEHGESSLFQRSIEYLATPICQKSSLRETFNFMVNAGFSKELAWQRSARHKYGFKDTQVPGDIMKPAMYFYQQQKVRELTVDERYRLFMGKITAESLEKYPVYRGRIALNTLKEFFAWNDKVA